MIILLLFLRVESASFKYEDFCKLCVCVCVGGGGGLTPPPILLLLKIRIIFFFCQYDYE